MGRILAIVLIVGLGVVVAWAKRDKNPVLGQVRTKDLNVSAGEIRNQGNHLRIDSPVFRATLKHGKNRSITARFTFLGPTHKIVPLISGEPRQQIALKLRAESHCNLVYIQWRFSTPKIVITVKSNPGMTTPQQCQDHGYHNVAEVEMPAVSVGVEHTFTASVNEDVVTVIADDVQVWSGSVGSSALTFDGPAGFRSDNSRLILDLVTQ